jgi:hypothetical protein
MAPDLEGWSLSSLSDARQESGKLFDYQRFHDQRIKYDV